MQEARDHSSIPRRILSNGALTLASLVLVACLLAGAEAVVRLVTDVGRLGTEQHLFVNDAFGRSIGNRPNAQGIAFGVEVFTDSDGFRSDAARSQRAGERTVLVLGDSVGFGAGVELDEIATRLTEHANPGVRLINTSVIGYGIEDYANVTDHFLASFAGPVHGMIVLMCLNDVWVTRAPRVPEPLAMGAAARGAFAAGLVDVLKQSPTIVRINNSLRAHSSLYVLVRGVLTRPQARYWRGLLAAFERLDEAGFTRTMQPMRRIAAAAAKRAVPLHVIIQPFAQQMTPTASAMPQARVAAYLEQQSIAYVDTLPSFRAAAEPSTLFLPYDPVHLSPEGHAVVAAAIGAVLERM